MLVRILAASRNLTVQIHALTKLKPLSIQLISSHPKMCTKMTNQKNILNGITGVQGSICKMWLASQKRRWRRWRRLKTNIIETWRPERNMKFTVILVLSQVNDDLHYDQIIQYHIISWLSSLWSVLSSRSPYNLSRLCPPEHDSPPGSSG